ncbi:MAG: dTDP-4-dehydrorhamnose reductase [Pusillimonas sp.]
MKILLLGKNGQVGWELQRSLMPLGEVIALGREDSTTLCGNLTRPDRVRATIRQIKPHVIVNAAAYTAVDQAEREPALAHQVNALGPAVLAEEARSLDAVLVHYSTDYVFNGSGSQPWLEDDRPDPLNVYGHSKLAGERAIRAIGCRHLIFRTSWVYAARGHNFAKTMVRLFKERDHLRVINDQVGAPTGADLIADITAHAIHQVTQKNTGDWPASDATSTSSNTSDIYHLAAGGETSWFGYAQFLLSEYSKHGMAASNATLPDIQPVPSLAFPASALRPQNSRLDTGKLQRTFGLYLPPWQQGLQRLLDNLLPVVGRECHP